MKITETLYKCQWCGNLQEHTLARFHGIKCTYQGQINCKKCGRHINQK